MEFYEMMKRISCLQWFSEILHHSQNIMISAQKKSMFGTGKWWKCWYLCSAHLKPSNISTDDVGVSFVEIVEEKRQVRWVILTLTYLLLRRAISGKGVRTLSGSTCLNGVDLPNEFIFLSNEIFKRFNC